jgi:hypothetical protein
MEGACFCQSVRYQIDPPTARASHCHCQSCRLAHGAAFVTWTSVPRARFRFLQGGDGLSTYQSSPGVRRHFCRRCGSHLLYDCDAEPDIIYLTVAHLLELPSTPVDRHVSFEEQAPWAAGAASLPRYRAKSDERM